MRNLLTYVLSVLVMCLLFTGCKNTSTALVPETMSPAEKEVYALMKEVEMNWIKQDFDGVFVHYASDGVFTGKDNAPVSKNELLKLCNDTSKEVKIIKLNIENVLVEGDMARVDSVLKMSIGNNSINHKENYELEKRNGTWLIVKEVNP